MSGSAVSGSPISSSALASHIALYASSSGLFTATTGTLAALEVERIASSGSSPSRRARAFPPSSSRFCGESSSVCSSPLGSPPSRVNTIVADACGAASSDRRRCCAIRRRSASRLSDGRFFCSASASMMSIRSLITLLSASDGGAASTATESYSSARAMRIARVSDVPMPGPVTLFASRATARRCTMSPGLSASESIESDAVDRRAFARRAAIAPSVPDLNVNVSPSPELTMYSNDALAMPKSSFTSAASGMRPFGARSTLSCAGVDERDRRRHCRRSARWRRCARVRHRSRRIATGRDADARTVIDQRSPCVSSRSSSPRRCARRYRSRRRARAA